MVHGIGFIILRNMVRRWFTFTIYVHENFIIIGIIYMVVEGGGKVVIVCGCLESHALVVFTWL